MGLFKEFHDPVPALIAATPTKSIQRTDIYQMPLLHKWTNSSGRVLLLGDACHAPAPNLAQGQRYLLLLSSFCYSCYYF